MSQTSFLLRPSPPFRLDLTAWALRRRPQNLVDRWDGASYRRVIVSGDQPFELVVTETGEQPATLRVAIHGGTPDSAATHSIRRAVVNALGTGIDLGEFYRVAAQDSRLAMLANRFRGVKPPRFYSVFEGLINGIACQQVTLSLGIQLLNRLAQNFSLSVAQDGLRSYAFPRPQDLAPLEPEAIRKLGFNFQKARAMIEISRAIVEGRLDLEELLSASDEEVLSKLTKLRGVGRWTAELTMLRAMGRWNIFPLNDQGARNGLARWLRLRKPLDSARTQRLVMRWHPCGGLVYFHMLMKGLDEAGYLDTGDSYTRPDSRNIASHVTATTE